MGGMGGVGGVGGVGVGGGEGAGLTVRVSALAPSGGQVVIALFSLTFLPLPAHPTPTPLTTPTIPTNPTHPTTPVNPTTPKPLCTVSPPMDPIPLPVLLALARTLL